MAASSLTVNSPNRQDMLAANSQYATSRPAYIGDLGLPPSKQYLIITCIDARIDPAAAFGIHPGEAHVIRNAGGSAVAALRDIIISTHFLAVKEVFIIKHTDCGMKFLWQQSQPEPAGQNKSINEMLYPEKIQCPGAASIADMHWHEIKCPYGAVRQDWWYVQNHPAIRAQDKNITIHGFVYNVKTGQLDDVQPRVRASTNPAPGSQPNGPDPPEREGGNCGGGASCGGGNDCGDQRGANGTPTQPSNQPPNQPTIQQPNQPPIQRPNQPPIQQQIQSIIQQPIQPPVPPPFLPPVPPPVLPPAPPPADVPASTPKKNTPTRPNEPRNTNDSGRVSKSGTRRLIRPDDYMWGWPMPRSK